MQKFNQSVLIQASPARVWHVLAHAEQFDLQAADTREVITSAQKHGVGVTLRVTRRIGLLTLVLNGTMTEWDDARVMASEWTSGLPFALATQVRMMLRAENGGTRLEREYAVRVKLPLAGSIAEMFLTRNTAREMQSLLERIKAAAENALTQK